MNGYRESDSRIVSEKPSNKGRDNKRSAERVERRRLAKGNSSKRNRGQAQNWITLPSELERVRQAASIGTLVRQYLKQEPSALAVHAGICVGGAGNRHSYRDLLLYREAFCSSLARLIT